MPASFHPEAPKAQAIAIYTNAEREKAKNTEYIAKISIKNKKGYTDKQTLEEMWGDSFEEYYKKFTDAVDSIFGTVITYENKPILAAYHSMSNGMTENCENVWGEKKPYLVAVSSPGDTFCENHTSEKIISISEIRNKLKTALPEVFLPEVDSLIFTDIEKSEAGTVLSLVIGNTAVSGKKIREIFSLRSASFDIEVLDGQIKFTTYGHGHGVGLSQYGADFMARQGSDYAEILAHYYSGSTLMYTKQ
jgi:stage II sporulation protein D